ncbi:DUF6387 family protein [Burkholderia cenocepacia]|uniref:DUF6387 family protein n=1 Tax=Burkholderia cenocepacia TaxID=95486 RepID=UPI002876BEDB|nr:DUF6387 family protein [Burkholderia cenocepacia]MDS0802850.1 DUF6387 family protein [Burkholderia cenocepacia]
MNQKPLSAAEIPASFQLEKYDVCGSWDLVDWCSALTERWQLKAILDMEERSVSNGEEQSGMIMVARDKTLASFEKIIQRQGARMSPFEGADSPIKDLSAMDYFEGIFALGDDRYSMYANTINTLSVKEMPNFSAITGADTLEDLQAWKMHEQCGVDKSDFWIKVDLGAPDDFLVKEFAAWLRSTRKAAQIPRMPSAFTNEHFADWHDKRLLPYIDLTLWARANDAYIQPALIGNLLFPDDLDRDIPAVVRRTVAPSARAICSWSVISALNAQVKRKA